MFKVKRFLNTKNYTAVLLYPSTRTEESPSSTGLTLVGYTTHVCRRCGLTWSRVKLYTKRDLVLRLTLERLPETRYRNDHYNSTRRGIPTPYKNRDRRQDLLISFSKTEEDRVPVQWRHPPLHSTMSLYLEEKYSTRTKKGRSQLTEFTLNPVPEHLSTKRKTTNTC